MSVFVRSSGKSNPSNVLKALPVFIKQVKQLCLGFLMRKLFASYIFNEI
jgi:hypothetical protein